MPGQDCCAPGQPEIKKRRPAAAVRRHGVTINRRHSTANVSYWPQPPSTAHQRRPCRGSAVLSHAKTEQNAVTTARLPPERRAGAGEAQPFVPDQNHCTLPPVPLPRSPQKPGIVCHADP
eukprot:CAMPEP_0174350650 /NCGR_PEP_ID=MMETSP0811_2-20130205/7782_1 /TAXON_ID=73025 ORGANISM="Eutreptiella gymnastica-like, Strain CCMP1594" /NCGR_SAMPLE_ID=MMETSP0811_2 /ASSEMBLY_ACC=CAM_ASM_000667 /LENGTH=119 /DNA_ID=CAMNT_0015479143 /DNA_START=100 /DNA_END=456 /DNA_ORIENTATION=-